MEDVKIRIDTKTYPSYSKFQNAFFEDSSYLAGFNRRTNSIDVFNLSSRMFSKHVNMDQKGPNGVGDVSGFYIHNWDSIFVFSYFKLAIVDSSGLVSSSYDLFDLGIQDFEGDASIGVDLGIDLYYSRQRNSIFVKYVPRNIEFYSKEFYAEPFIGELLLDSMTLKTIPFEHSKYIKENYVAAMDMPTISFNGSEIFCCFTGESNIYSLDLENGKSKAFGGRSAYTKNIATPLARDASKEQKDQHRLESASFFNLRYDPYRDLYYRLHFGDIKYRMSDDINERYGDKGLYLMIFNSDVELIKEIELEKYTYLPEFYGISEEGLFLNANHDMNLDYEGEYANFKLLRMT